MSRTTEQDNEFHGVGGSFIVGKDGKRARVEETSDHPEGNRPRNAKGEAIVDKPLAREDLAKHLAGLPAPAPTKPWLTEADKSAPPAGALDQGTDMSASTAITETAKKRI